MKSAPLISLLLTLIFTLVWGGCGRHDDSVGEKERDDYDTHIGYMPEGGIKLKVNSIGGTYGKVFNDSNYLHLREGEHSGIMPIETLADAWQQGENLVELKSCRYYYLDNLTHSLPYLVPCAATLLEEIGQRFNDSLQARGGGDYRIKVTSVLRTPESVSRLKKRNINASQRSAHQYGTTFDISYAKFICDSEEVPRSQGDLKNLLAEILKQLRDDSRCYVKYERKQGCFHITARCGQNPD